MALWEKIRGQFIDVIEWLDPTQDTLVYRFPRGDNEIKNGAQLIVRESQVAVFIHEGQLGDVFRPGRYELTTRNIPVLTSLASWKYAFNSPFKCEVYFVNTKQFTNLKWGTQNPVMLRDPELGPVRLRAFGTYAIQCVDAAKLVLRIAGTDAVFQVDEISGQLRAMLVSRFDDEMATRGLAEMERDANDPEIGEKLRSRIQSEFEEYGLALTKLLVENVSFPPEVEQALDQRSKLGLLSNQLGALAQMKTAEAIGDMARNPGAGGAALGMVGAMNIGGAMAGAMQTAAPPPLPGQFYAAIGGQQAGPFDLQTLRSQAVSGALTRETLVWRQGMANWTPAGQVPELSALFAASSPPPLPKA
ncbi:MAG: SPFH domain-containing protein [Planctomycetota bacterium]|nr:SPFH domain-containing protein [Planctomycetota bacterium]